MVKFVAGQRNPKRSESAAGRLVWVRRKNGSWWPGQIMDVAESCLDDAKSNGVPIKLLGRDAANLEWYNLEVSKEVKDFHCKDLNPCIEKAKALQANSSKRKLNLSQRDNAIILALQLESSLMSKDSAGNFNNLVYFKKKRSKVVFKEIMEEDSIDLLTDIMQSDELVSVPIIYDELPNPCKSSDSDDNVSEFGLKRKVCYESSDNLFDVLLINETELSDGFPSGATRSSANPQNSTFNLEKNLSKWKSKRKRNPRQKRQNREHPLNRHEFLEPLIKPHVSPIVYYDVHIEVDGSHYSKNVQNILVEVLEDGACDFLLSTFMDYELTETRTRTSACIPLKVVFSRIHDALMG